MFKIGINENVVLQSVSKNDKGTLVAGFKQVEEIDILEAMNSGRTNLEEPTKDVLFFPPTVKNFDGSSSDGKSMLKKISGFQDSLQHILLVYLKSDKIKWDLYKGVNAITSENIYSKLENQVNVDIICSNLVNQFIAFATPLLNNKVKFRMKLVRSKDKYTSLPKFPPFVESQEVPLASTKLKFTPYEIQKGLDKPLNAEATTVSSAEAEEAKSVFA